ncbi:MAG: CDP-alcohol phosphatidyltransferase family protein [Acidobacteria bacterium]|nr:CDP-alcohol phosphatidyltransferase family protein [Acidobacteriota bacterium]
MPASAVSSVSAVASTAPAVTSHVRINTGVLAALERRTLLWMAARLPRWIHSDHLTTLGVMGMAGVGAAFALGGSQPQALWLVPLGLAINWFGDSLDGTLARVRNQQRPRYGYYVDHVLDVAGTALLFAGMALGGHMAPAIAASLLAAYVAVMAEVFLATATRGTFRMSFAGFGPTELRLILAAGALALLRYPDVRLPMVGEVRLFDVGGIAAIIGLTGVFVMSALVNGRALYGEERG